MTLVQKQMAQRVSSCLDSAPPACLQFYTDLAVSHAAFDPRELGQSLQTAAPQDELRAGLEGLACMDRVPRCCGPGGTHAGKAG